MFETMRILGLDIGDVRIGMALSDELLFTAQPLGVYERKGPRQDAAFLKEQIAKHGVTEVVVGMPYRMAGGMSTMGQRITGFIDGLKNICPVPIVFWGEQLTSVEANRAMLEGDLSRKKRKAKIDIMAAQLILQGYLESKRISRNREEEKKRWDHA